MRKLILLVLVAVMCSVLLHAENTKITVMGPYRGKLVIPEAGALALKKGKLVVIDMEASAGEEAEPIVKVMLNGRDYRWAPSHIIGVTW